MNIKKLLKQITTIDYQVIFVNNLPSNEAVTLNEDGSYTIFIKDSLSREKKIELFTHAIEHIIHDDFHSNKTATEIEKTRHKKPKEYL